MRTEQAWNPARVKRNEQKVSGREGEGGGGYCGGGSQSERVSVDGWLAEWHYNVQQLFIPKGKYSPYIRYGWCFF